MKRAMLVLFAVASLAACSNPSDPVSTDPIALRAMKTVQIMTITNSSSDPFYYSYFVGDGSAILVALCLDPQTCPSVRAHSSVSVRYADIPKAEPGEPVVTFMYYRLMPSVENTYRADSVRYAFVRLQ